MYSLFKNAPSRQTYLDSNITFIIPSLGRPTLQLTLNSLKMQTDNNWKAIVVFDGVSPNISNSDPRVEFISIPKKGSAGLVRNEGIRMATTEWVGFVDDDDVLTSDYVEHFNREKQNMDVVIFRMKTPKNIIHPPIDHTDFHQNYVGISFCMRTSLSKQENLWFPVDKVYEDFILLNSLRSAGKSIKISKHVTYLIRL